ncbi:MAG: NHLP bacteriocin export ABC transporter permease/ATPase subunit, partial [Clostridiaceae bacterium]|nr:NHLP bacteriocin export ABC transporter permease/ATPase subunit [Clostridiaceae bacterium]
YKLHDPRHDTTEIVNHETAQRIKPFAYTFYSSFPIKELNIWEALFISARSLWKIDFLFIMLMGLVAGILSMILPVATGLVFDEIIPQGERMQLIFIALFLGVGAISRLMFQFVQSLSLRRIEGRIDSNMQTSVWDRLLDLPIDFFRKFSSGELAMKAINIGNIRRILSGATIISILSAIFSIPGFFLLFYYNSELALRTMPLLLLAVVATILFGKIRMSYNKQETELGNKLSGFVFQLIRGISKLRVSGSEKRAFSMWAVEFSKLRQVGYCSEMFNNAFLVFTDLLPLVSSLIIFYWISTMHSEISIGIFIAFNAAFTNVLYSVLSLADALMKITYVIPIIESADCIFKTLPEYDQTKKDPGKLAGNIEVSHVSYRYEPSAPLVLNDICLHIQSGEYLAIVGSSGCGKSTLLRILLGFQKPEVGKVYYDEQDLEELDIRKVRKQLGVVMQNSCLMPGDIFTNIVGSNINLTIDDAWEAAKLAGLDEDIRKMPMGMHTYVSEGGSTLSGGQRQRILIARAIANKPSILFFDEATSALDNKTQAVVSRSLEQLNVTRVVIAHRLSTIVNCDRIVVMDKGGIVEEGTYEELISRKGVFAEMAERQLA